MNDHDVVVIGAGPSGSRAAWGLAKEHDVIVLEEHELVGHPVQCTGLFSPRVLELAGVDVPVLSRISGAMIHFPGGGTLPIAGKSVKGLVVDRGEFDRRMAERAVAAGAELRTNCKALSLHVARDEVRVATTDGDVQARLVVGADGHRSLAATKVGGRDPHLVRGIQVDLDHVLDDQSCMHVIMGNDIAPGFFAWMLPCGDFTRVGLGTDWRYGPPSGRLEPLLKRLGLDGTPKLRMHSGIIPIGPRDRTYADRILLVGDAAGQVKPVSGGGVWPGLNAADCLVHTASAALDEDDLSSRRLAPYQDCWKRMVGHDLDRAMRLRRAYTRLSDEQMDRIGNMLDREDVLDILNGGDIDDPAAAAVTVLRRVPGLLRFSPLILGSLLRR